MFTWDAVAVWVLQAIGAVGAIWGLFASETSRKDDATGRRMLTGRGWFALTGVMLGLFGFALNQYKDNQRAALQKAKDLADVANAEKTKSDFEVLKLQAKLQADRAQASKEQLSLVKLSQDQIAQSQGSLINSQRSQISFLTGLAMVQQQLSGIELSWREASGLRNKISQNVDGVIKGWKDHSENDEYFGRCLSFGDVVMTRRPNYGWQVACRVQRPMGSKFLPFEISSGDKRATLIDEFLDDVLTRNLVIQNSRGDTLLDANVGLRPLRVERRDGIYRMEFEVPRTRFSTLADPNISIRMDTQNLDTLPRWMRLKSRDPLARFDTQWEPEWQIRTIATVVVQQAADMDPEEVPVKAAVAPVRGFHISFDELLRPSTAGAR